MGELGTFTKGAQLSKADITETGTPLILYGELYTTYGDIANTIVRKTNKDVKSECYSILGDVIIPTSGESPEEISTCTCVMQDGVILAGDLNIYRTNNVDGRFLSYEINHVRNREIAKIAQGKSIVHIKADELVKIVIRFPSKAEQSKIIELFLCLDRKIELQKELIEFLKLYKRGLLAKLFPQKGESVPQYRFQGFADVWEQRKLGEVGVARSGIGFPDSEQGGIEGVPFFKVSDMNIEGNEHELIRANNYVSDEQIRRKRWNVISDVPAIFFAKVGAAVMLNRKRLVRFPFLLDNNTMAYIFDKDIWDCNFGKTLFETIDLTKLTQVGALPSYNASDVEGVKICLPERGEQQCVGAYFRHLDHLITLHQEKYYSYKKIKSALLQQMFI